jgi:XisI protein
MVLSRFFIPIVHLDVRDGKVWIQHNATKEEIADDLMGLGIEGQLGCIVCFCALVRILWWLEGAIGTQYYNSVFKAIAVFTIITLVDDYGDFT